MTPNVKYYKIVLLKNFLEKTHQARMQLFDELAIHAIDPVIYKRRFRMLTHLNQYEQQIIKKIQNFDTSDVNDLTITPLAQGLYNILNKSA
jgi:chemotaxis response regulator CheB